MPDARARSGRDPAPASRRPDRLAAEASAIGLPSPPRRQGGWVGLLVLLLAVVLVALLGKTILQQWLGGAATQAGKAGERGGMPAAAVVPDTGAGTATPLSGTPIERARGVDPFVQQQTEAQKRNVDAAAGR